MPEQWLYWIVYIAQTEGKTAFHGKLMDTKRAINSPDVIADIRYTLYVELYGEPTEEMDEDFPPIVLLTWTLVTAKKGVAVEAPEHRPRRKRKPKDNGAGHA